jgi:hypothetical protein
LTLTNPKSGCCPEWLRQPHYEWYHFTMELISRKLWRRTSFRQNEPNFRGPDQAVASEPAADASNVNPQQLKRARATLLRSPKCRHFTLLSNIRFTVGDGAELRFMTLRMSDVSRKSVNRR